MMLNCSFQGGIMAGVKQLDAEVSLDRDADVFWLRGFEATSIQDLVEATGVGRASFYATFGDKETLFARARPV